MLLSLNLNLKLSSAKLFRYSDIPRVFGTYLLEPLEGGGESYFGLLYCVILSGCTVTNYLKVMGNENRGGQEGGKYLEQFLDPGAKYSVLFQFCSTLKKTYFRFRLLQLI
jgi:hypothetical protein